MMVSRIMLHRLMFLEGERNNKTPQTEPVPMPNSASSLNWIVKFC